MADERVALVTGGGSGIGAAVARRLAAEGELVIVCGRRVERLESIAARIRADGGRAEALALDVTDWTSITEAVSEASRFGSVQRYVASAGIAISAPLLARDGDPDELHQRHLDVNYHGSRRVFEALLPGMLAAGSGQAVFVASSAALVGYAYVAAYCASKHAILGYARAAAIELEKKGIGIGVVCPWYVDSPMTDASVARIAETTGKSQDEARALLAAQNPGGRLVTVDEVATSVFELFDSQQTGRVVELDGSEGSS